MVLLPPSGAYPGAYPSLGVDRITILTGTDQAAVVAAYQTIKSIVAGCGGAGRATRPRIVHCRFQ